MKRSEFFKRIIGGAIAVAVAPEVLAAASKPKVFITTTVEEMMPSEEAKKIWAESDLRKYPLTEAECYRPEFKNYLQVFREHYTMTDQGGQSIVHFNING